VPARFDTHQISNGGTEAVNLIIEKTRRLAHSFRTVRPLPAPHPPGRLRTQALPTSQPCLSPKSRLRVRGGWRRWRLRRSW
jgi:hypothetical protein